MLAAHKPGFWERFVRSPQEKQQSDSVKRHLRGRHLSVLNLKFDFISDGGCIREEQIALSLKRHLFPHGGREPKAFWICFSRVHPPSEIKSNFKFKTLKRHLLKRHLTLSETLSSLHFLQSGPRKFTKSDFLGIGPDPASYERRKTDLSRLRDEGLRYERQTNFCELLSLKSP